MSSHAEHAPSPFEVTPVEKVKFGAIVLPVLGILGTILREAGTSEETTFVVVVSLLFVAFFGWHGTRVRSGARLPREVSVQDALRQLKLRQQAEQAQLLEGHPSTEQLTRMMDRHRSQYEALIERRTV